MAIFGEEATVTAAHMRKLCAKGNSGKTPKKEGRPKSISDEVTEKVIEWVALYRSFKIPVYKNLVISYLMRLVEDSSYEMKFTTGPREEGGEPKWDRWKLDHWYVRRFLGDNDEVTTGAQRAQDVLRNNWGTSAACQPYYDDAKEALLTVSARRSPQVLPLLLGFTLTASPTLPRYI